MTLEFEAIGTHWRIELPEGTPSAIETKIKERIALFDKDYSRFREDSLITTMSRVAGTYTLPSDAKPLFDLYHKLYLLTDGVVTPLIGQTLVDAGYDKNYSLKPSKLSPPPAWDEVLEYAYPHLTLKQPALLDLGALGKGYLVDIISELVEREGIERYVIDAGGDMRVRSPSRIGLEHPEDNSSVVGIAEIQEGAICGSAGNRRAWGEYHHLIHPKTLTSPKDILAVWVTASTALAADALTTYLFLIPVRKSVVQLKEFTYEFVVVYADYTYDRSSGFPGELFLDSRSE